MVQFLLPFTANISIAAATRQFVCAIYLFGFPLALLFLLFPPQVSQGALASGDIPGGAAVAMAPIDERGVLMRSAAVAIPHAHKWRRLLVDVGGLFGTKVLGRDVDVSPSILWYEIKWFDSGVVQSLGVVFLLMHPIWHEEKPRS